MTKQDWVRYLKEHSKVLRALVESYHPASDAPPPPQMQITAPAAEQMRMVTARIVKARFEGGILAKFNEVLHAIEGEPSERDLKTVALILSGTWHGIPESLEAQLLPGFSQLCTLLDDPADIEWSEEDEDGLG